MNFIFKNRLHRLIKMKTYLDPGLQINNVFKEPINMAEYEFWACALHNRKIHYLHVKAREGSPRDWKIY